MSMDVTLLSTGQVASQPTMLPPFAQVGVYAVTIGVSKYQN